MRSRTEKSDHKNVESVVYQEKKKIVRERVPSWYNPRNTLDLDSYRALDVGGVTLKEGKRRRIFLPCINAVAFPAGKAEKARPLYIACTQDTRWSRMR